MLRRAVTSELDAFRSERNTLEADRASDVKAKAVAELRCRELEEWATSDADAKVRYKIPK